MGLIDPHCSYRYQAYTDQQNGDCVELDKQGMDRAGIDTSTYRPHSIRSATVSTVKHKKGVSLRANMKRGQWRHNYSLKKYYLRDLDSTGSFKIAY